MTTPQRARPMSWGKAGFTPPEKLPWSEIGPEFIEDWGHDGKGRLIGEGTEIAGQTGSGKSYVLASILQQRVERWNSAVIIILTKESDDSIPLLGWPVVGNSRDLRKYRQVIFWPQTAATGEDREAYHEQQIYELLSSLWTKDANVVIAFDEIGYVEELRDRSGKQRLKRFIKMMWREARSHKISIAAMKQRPVGVTRDQHSETRWKIVFPPAHQADMEAFAELLGRKVDWQPVLEGLDRQRHEFVIYNSFTGDAYVSWMDVPLKPLPEQADQQGRTPADVMKGRRASDPRHREG